MKIYALSCKNSINKNISWNVLYKLNSLIHNRLYNQVTEFSQKKSLSLNSTKSGVKRAKTGLLCDEIKIKEL